MDIYEAIRTRCSVRTYLEKPVEQEKLDRVLDAGRLSPSARNTQGRKFVVVREPSTRRALAEACEQGFVAKAPVVVAVVTLEPNRVMYCGIPAGPVDCAIAIDHMTLAAVAEGLGTCWIGHFDQARCCELLGVPAGFKIVEMMLLGYPAEAAKPKPRKHMSEVACYEKFA